MDRSALDLVSRQPLEAHALAHDVLILTRTIRTFRAASAAASQIALNVQSHIEAAYGSRTRILSHFLLDLSLYLALFAW